MMFIFLASAVYSVLYLRKFDVNYDLKVQALTSVGILYGVLGLITGAVWAKHTWGAYWSWDVKQNMAAVAMLVYCAYFVLRGSFDDMEKSARLSAVYNIFAFAALPALLFVIPRLTDSLHPGNGGNPGFGGQDLDNTMRLVFYPAIIGFTMFGFWMAELVFRYQRLKNTVLEQ
jgi:heme exporter protein C